MTVPDLNTPLLWIGESGVFTVADAVEGVQILGGVGSGKTTGSGALLAKSYLSHGFGTLVCCAKSDESARFERYAHETGRDANLFLFSPRRDERHHRYWRFNFLDYEFRRAGRGAGLVENIVELINVTKSIVEGNHGISSDSHWERASNELIRNAVHLLVLSQGKLSLDALYQLIMDAPEGEQVEDMLWQKRSFCWQCLTDAEHKATTPRETHNLRMARRYWLQTYAGLADRTRSSIYSTFSAIADVLLHDSIYELLCTETTLVPEMTYENAAIIVMDMPIREFGKAGIVVQKLFKYCWERAMLRRDITQNSRPVMLFADEAQNFLLNDFDQFFLAELRAARVAPVFITQNISNYYAALGNHDEVHGILANLGTKIIHALTDPTSTVWAAEAIGFATSYRRSWSAGNNEMGNYFNFGANEQRLYQVEPTAFTTLSKGAEPNQWRTDAIIFQSGRQWQATGTSWLKASIMQENAPVALLPAKGHPTLSEWIPLIVRLVEWLLILHWRGNPMDVFLAMYWEDNLSNTPRQQELGDGIFITADEEVFPILHLDNTVTVQAAFVSGDPNEDKTHNV